MGDPILTVWLKSSLSLSHPRWAEKTAHVHVVRMSENTQHTFTYTCGTHVWQHTTHNLPHTECQLVRQNFSFYNKMCIWTRQPQNIYDAVHKQSRWAKQMSSAVVQRHYFKQKILQMYWVFIILLKLFYLAWIISSLSCKLLMVD
jgi:hypothetical protein